MDHSSKAAQLFLSGSNCAQAVFVAFCDVTGLEPEFAARLACGFGGGISRMREVCGAVSGMILAADVLYGYSDPGQDDEAKAAHYTRIQGLCSRFRQSAGSLTCRELLDHPPTDPTPTPRTAEYYASRPCTAIVMLAARILEEYIQANPPVNNHE